MYNNVIESKDYRKSTITILSKDGDVLATYKGGHYIYFGDKSDGCFHFSDENNKHHRVYGDAIIIVDED